MKKISDFEIYDLHVGDHDQIERFDYNRKGFYIWQFHGVIIDTTTNRQMVFSDTPSGCGPVQIYNYGSLYFSELISEFKKILSFAFERAVNYEYPFMFGATAFTFVQGNPSKEFIEMCKEDFGAEVKLYWNSRHGEHKDIQGFFYIDLTKESAKASVNKERRAEKTLAKIEKLL